jgi:predicted Zn finger-like uncharacterized protein
MLIACPNCSTSYTIDPASLGEAGRTVRCARCKTTWFASKPELATAGTDDDPTPAIGVIRPDQRMQDRAEGTGAEEHTSETVTQDEEAAQAPVTIADAPPIAPEEPPTAARKPTRSKILPRAASGFRHDVTKSGARHGGLRLFLSSSPSMLRWSVPAARL